MINKYDHNECIYDYISSKITTYFRPFCLRTSLLIPLKYPLFDISTGCGCKRLPISVDARDASFGAAGSGIRTSRKMCIAAREQLQIGCKPQEPEMHAMDLMIEGDGANAVQEIGELGEWLREARLKDVKDVTQRRRPPGPGEQGPEWLQILEIILAAPAALAVIGCIKDYIIARRPKIKITIKTKSGSVVIDATNPPSPAELEHLAKTLTPAA